MPQHLQLRLYQNYFHFIIYECEEAFSVCLFLSTLGPFSLDLLVCVKCGNIAYCFLHVDEPVQLKIQL